MDTVPICIRFKGKYGRIRRNLMGRRADHMGRSFITGDVYKRITEIGIPLEAIARSVITGDPLPIAVPES